MNIAIVANNNFNNLTAHPLFVLELYGALATDHLVWLIIPNSTENRGVDYRKVQQLGMISEFKVVKLPYLNIKGRLRKSFFYVAGLYLSKKRIDLVWSFEPYTPLALLRPRIKSIVELHMSTPKKRMLKNMLRLQKKTYFLGFVTNSMAHSQLLEKMGVIVSKSVAGYNAIPSSWLSSELVDLKKLRADLGLKNKNQVCTYAGSLYKGRGLEEIITVAKLLRDVDFVIIGGTSKQVDYYKELAGSENILFTGRVSHNQVNKYLLSSDVLLAPYRADCEDIAGNNTIATAAPMKIFEYMAAGKPIISSNIGAIPEFIIHGQNGILINPGDTDAMGKWIKELLTNKDISIKIGRNAKSDTSLYSWGERLRRINNALNYLNNA